MINPVVDRVLRRFFFDHNNKHIRGTVLGITQIKSLDEIDEHQIMGIKTESGMLRIFADGKIERYSSSVKVVEAKQYYIPLSNDETYELIDSPFPNKGFDIKDKHIVWGLYQVGDVGSGSIIDIEKDDNGLDPDFGVIDILNVLKGK